MNSPKRSVQFVDATKVESWEAGLKDLIYLLERTDVDCIARIEGNRAFNIVFPEDTEGLYGGYAIAMDTLYGYGVIRVPKCWDFIVTEHLLNGGE